VLFRVVRLCACPCGWVVFAAMYLCLSGCLCSVGVCLYVDCCSFVSLVACECIVGCLVCVRWCQWFVGACMSFVFVHRNSESTSGHLGHASTESDALAFCSVLNLA